MRTVTGAIGLVLVVASLRAAGQDPTLVTDPPERFAMRVVASGLDGPWELTWGPDQQLWVTERKGLRVLRVNPVDGTRSALLTLHEAHQSVGQDGLLGMALHPDLLKGTGNDYVYLAFTWGRHSCVEWRSGGIGTMRVRVR